MKTKQRYIYVYVAVVIVVTWNWIFKVPHTYSLQNFCNYSHLNITVYVYSQSVVSHTSLEIMHDTLIAMLQPHVLQRLPQNLWKDDGQVILISKITEILDFWHLWNLLMYICTSKICMCTVFYDGTLWMY